MPPCIGAALPRAARNSTGGRGRGTASQATVAIITLGRGGTIDRPAERQKPRFQPARGTRTASAAVRRPPQTSPRQVARRSDERLYCGFAEVAPRSTAGRPALQGREPGQVRKEAATAIHCKCRGNGSPPLLFVVQIDLILCCSPAPTLTYVHVRSALSPVRAASQADLVTNSRRFDLRPA